MLYFDLPLYPQLPAAANAGSDRGTTRADRFLVTVGQPLVSVVVADQPTGASVVICPGGGYEGVCLDKEGHDFARLLASWGITALVLTYRQPGGVFVDPPLPHRDARAALELAAGRAAEWGLDPAQLGLMGFSAGGHLALTTALDPAHAAPAFLVLGYPVVSLRPPLAHAGSRDNLLGRSAPAERVDRYSGELHVRSDLGPTFLVHSDDDGAVPSANSVALQQALSGAGVPCELIRHPTGEHGYGMGPAHGYPAAPDWTPRLHEWLKSLGLAR